MVIPAKQKYCPAPAIPMAVRQWPTRTLTQAPRWCSTDLRDGNQALATPMSFKQKAEMFPMLVGMGFREIEAGFPAASQEDYDFIRHLAREIPENVTVQVLTTAREEHIDRTFASLQGISRAIVHFYISTSPIQRRVVFGVDEHTLIQRAKVAAERIRAMAEKQRDTQWTFQFSPESYSATEPEFALAICEAVVAVWEPTRERQVIFNLPATVEVASPNRYADQIEWFATHFSQRERVVISIHPHNDRGCGVAAAELALLAGADRVEGALFGNGERTGNLDLVTLAMNLYSQGIETGLDFSRMPEILECYRRCTGMGISPRHPYVGELVYTAFSGSHQDAIRKGLAKWQPGEPWEVPYIPIDPRDIGYDMNSIIRINSQSGKGGAAHRLEQERGITLPKWFEPEFAREVQQSAEQSGQELSGEEISAIFDHSFLYPRGEVKMTGYRMFRDKGCRVEMEMMIAEKLLRVSGQGNGPIEAACHALPGPWTLHRYEEHALDVGSDARAIAFIALTANADGSEWSGVGIHEDIVAASLHALVAAINRHVAVQSLMIREEILSGWLSCDSGSSPIWNAVGYSDYS